MGANFAPVYANLMMGYWEEGYIWANNPFAEHIVFFGRYIDDILLIWGGGPDVFPSFVAHCNANPSGFSFTHVRDPNELAFLDLVLTHDHSVIVTKNHIKPTSGNSYLYFDSCHHPTWKQNIPRGQFNRLRRNCSRLDEYVTQEGSMPMKFEEKGYPRELVQDAFLTHMNPPSKKQNLAEVNDNHAVRFVSTFKNKFMSVSKI